MLLDETNLPMDQTNNKDQQPIVQKTNLLNIRYQCNLFTVIIFRNQAIPAMNQSKPAIKQINSINVINWN